MTVVTADTKDVGNGIPVTPLPLVQVMCICMVQISEAMNGKYIQKNGISHTNDFMLIYIILL